MTGLPTGAPPWTAGGVTAVPAATSVPAVDWFALSPVAVVVGALLLILLLDAVPTPGRPAGGAVARHLMDALAMTGLLGAAAMLWLLADGLGEVVGGRRSTLCGDGFDTCSYVVSPLTLTLQAVVVVLAVVCLLLALDDLGEDRVAHHVLFLSAVAGALALAGARDLVSLLVALEVASLPAVALVARRRDAPGAQAGLTLLLTAVGSLGLFALGAALLLLATGSLHLERVAPALADPTLPGPVRALAALGVLLAVAGIAFKLSAVPFHLWTPDTFAGAPVPTAAFLSVVSKAAALAALVVLLALGAPALVHAWAPVLGVLAVVTMTVGNLVALRQQVAVRLLAWSTVAQAGWLLLPLAAAGPRFAVAGTGEASALRPAVAASVGYMVAYGAAGVTAFAVVVVLSRRVADGHQHTVQAYRGLARREPVAAAVLAFALACLAGLPPGVVGLVAKLVALRPVVDGELWLLAVIAAANVALGVAYYLRWGALLVSAPAPGVEVPTWRVRPAEGLAVGAGAAACLMMSAAPQLVAGLLPGALR